MSPYVSPIVDGATALTSQLIPARRFNLRPDTGQDMRSGLQFIFDSAPDNCTIITEPGEYLINSEATLSRSMRIVFNGHWTLQADIKITADNAEMVLGPGCYIEKDPTGTAIEPFYFVGVAPASWDNLTVDPNAGEVTITVTTPANFDAGDWIMIKDDQERYYGGGFKDHWEINKVRSKSGSVLTLEYPLSDNYPTLSLVAPSVSTFTPVQNSGLVGPGKISNGSASNPEIGNAGVRFKYTVGSYCKGVEFFQFQQDAIRVFDSTQALIKDNFCHDSSNMFGSGRGVDVGRTTHVQVLDNRFVRTRHAVDISNFARHTLVAGNISRGAGESHYKCHPDVKWCTFENNQCDGAWGLTEVAAQGNEWGTTWAPGFGMDRGCSHIYILNNQIQNIRIYGIGSLPEDSEHIVVRGNTLHNCNTSMGSIYGAITFIEATAGATTNWDGYIIENNWIQGTVGRGIMCGVSKAVIRGNTILDVSVSGAPSSGIFLAPYVSGTGEDTVDDVVIENNYIQGVDGQGITVGRVDALTKRTHIRGNTIRDCTESGIFATPDWVEDIWIKDNFVYNCNTDANLYQGSIVVGVYNTTTVDSIGEVLIEGNKVDGSNRAIYFTPSNTVCRRNQVYNATIHGIFVPNGQAGQDSEDIVIEDNLCQNCVAGIYMGGTSGGTQTNPVIQRNTIIGGTYGLRLRATVSGAKFIDNTTFNVTYPILDESSTNLVVVSHFDPDNYGREANVRDWGAKGNGSTDDTTVIQAAIDSGASKVYFPAGTYKITSQLDVPSGVLIEGDGESSIISAATLSSGYALSFAGTEPTSLGSPSADPVKLGRTLTFSSAPSVSEGDVLLIRNPTTYSWHGSRDYYKEGEWNRVSSVSGSVITLVSPLYSGYTAANVTVYKLTAPSTCNVRNLRINMPLSGTAQVAAISASLCVDTRIENIAASGSDYALLRLDRCYDASISKCHVVQSTPNAPSLDYGVVAVSCQHVRISDSYLLAKRHAVTIGEAADACPSRDVIVSNATLICRENTHAAADFHGGSEFCVYEDCTIEGGLDLAGDNQVVRNCTFIGRGASGSAIYCTELKGMSHTIENCGFYTDGGGDSSRGLAIDIGGNSSPLSSDTDRGGTFRVKGCRFIDSASSPTSQRFITSRNRGCTTTVNFEFIDNSFETQSSALGLIFHDVVSGSVPNLWLIDGLRSNKGSIDLNDIGDSDLRNIRIETAEDATHCVSVEANTNDSLLVFHNIDILTCTYNGIECVGGSPTGVTVRASDCTVLGSQSGYYGILIQGVATAIMTGCHSTGSASIPLRINTVTLGIALGNSSLVGGTITTKVEMGVGAANQVELPAATALRAGGGFAGNYEVILSTDTLDANNHHVLADTSGGAFTLTLPATDGAGIGEGKTYTIKRAGGSLVTIAAAGSNTIEGGSTYTGLSSAGFSITIRSNGLSGASGIWEIISGFGVG